MEKDLKRIEFDKVLEILSNEASSEAAQIAIKNIVPARALETVKMLMSETFDAYNLSLKLEFPSFSGIFPIESVLSRACGGAILQNIEFLHLLSTLGENIEKKKKKKHLLRRNYYLFLTQKSLIIIMLIILNL